MKKFVFIAGLPASGKDTVAEFFESKGFFRMTYSSMILKPIVEDTKNSLGKFSKNLIEIEKPELNIIAQEIDGLKKIQKGRELYITLGGKYLNTIISKYSNEKYNHFSAFCKNEYDKHQDIVVAGFRMKEEIETIEKLYSDANITTVLIKSDDELRYNRMMSRDNIDIEEIKRNEKYERETTYQKIIENVEFDIIIENNSNYEELIKKLKEIPNIQ